MLDVDLYQKLKQQTINKMQLVKNNFLTDNQKRLAVLLVMLFLSSVKMFGQATNVAVSEVNTTLVTNNTSLIAATDSDIDFMNWFMGSRQAQASASSTDVSSTTNTKKQLIISGGTTNRLLYKTLVKKLISIDNAIV